jgi:hypothetical protein
MTTITASTTIGIDLNPAFYTSPVVIGAGVTVSNPGYPYAVYRHSGATTFFVIDNKGTITSSTGGGVYLGPGGSVTNEASASISAVGYAVRISDSAGTVVNDGTIRSTGPTSGSLLRGNGISLLRGGSVTNAATASIIATADAVRIGGNIGDTGTVVNDGSITGGSFGVFLTSGGSITNEASAYITGGVDVTGGTGTVVNEASAHIAATGYAVRISGGTGTVVNDGSIAGGQVGGQAGVLLEFGGSVTNEASAHIAAGYGVRIVGGTGIVVNDGSIAGGSFGVELSGTLTNAGSIIGSNGTAVEFFGTDSNRLALEAGFGFSGLVTGGLSSSNTLELASGSSTGTVTGLGSEFLRFRTITFDPGAQWSISGIQRGLAGPIYGFAYGDTIEFTGVTATGSSFVSGVLTLDLAGGGTATLDLPGTFTSATDFVVTNVAAGADVTVACFVAGTRILTAAGEMPVEELTVGAHVPTAASRLARIIWLGHQRATVPPVRVRAGAFGNDTPARDLLLSPDHAVFADGVLIPVRYLVNGSTVVQEPVDEVTYYHVELAEHDVILAEGLPCESYLDTGNRAAFANGELPALIAARPTG